MIKINQKVFDENLRLTKAYCELQLSQFPEKSPAEIFRSIDPMYKGLPLFSFKKMDNYIQADWNTDQLASQCQSVYDELFEIQLKQKKVFFEGNEMNHASDGTILITSIDEVITDGISEMESSGFIDYNDCTPIDTWFYIADDGNNRVLFSWIPAQFIALAEEGINVNMLRTFEWYNTESLRLREESKIRLNKYRLEKKKQTSLFTKIVNFFR